MADTKDNWLIQALRDFENACAVDLKGRYEDTAERLTRRMEQEKLEAEMDMLKWCLSRTSMDELKQRWTELIALKKGTES